MKRLSVLLAVVIILAACGDGPSETVAIAPGLGANSPQEAVTDLIAYLNEPNFSAATSLAMPDQAALASLAEGATFADVANALETGDPSVVANFWSGFAQGAGAYLAGDVTTDEAGVAEHGSVEFLVVEVTPIDGGRREMLVRESDGFRIDLFASFGAGLAGKMGPPVERLLASQTADSALIISELKQILPSLEAAANRPDMSPTAVQEIIQLIELITRVS